VDRLAEKLRIWNTRRLESLWRRADQKWHAYPAAPQVGSIEAFLKLVAVDKHACFFVSAVA